MLLQVYRKSPPPIVSTLGQCAQTQGYSINVVPLDTSESLRSKRLIFMTEIYEPMFNDITATEWRGLQNILKYASSALWVTKGGLLKNQQPAFAVISGIARGISTEMNHLQLSLLDLDTEIEQSVSKTCELLLRFERRNADGSTENYTEYRQKDDIIFTSRLQADRFLNECSRTEAKHQASEELTCLDELKHTPLQLDIENPSIFSSLYFREDYGFNQSLNDDCVEIEVEAAGVNNRVRVHYQGTKEEKLTSH